MANRELGSEHQLRDGTRARIRPIGRDDARTIQDGFRRLSPESRRRRFRRPKQSLSEGEVRFLTDADGRRRVALGAVRIDADGWEHEGLGVASYACLPDRPDVAEPSVVVVDGAQGIGVGRLLSEELIRVARANGVKSFRALLSSDHGWLRDRIGKSYPDARLTRRGELLGAEFPLPALPPASGEAPPRGGDRSRTFNLLRWVAEGVVRAERPGALKRLSRRFKKGLSRRLRKRLRRGPRRSVPPAA